MHESQNLINTCQQSLFCVAYIIVCTETIYQISGADLVLIDILLLKLLGNIFNAVPRLKNINIYFSVTNISPIKSTRPLNLEILQGKSWISP